VTPLSDDVPQPYSYAADDDAIISCDECGWEGVRDLLADHEDDRDRITRLACPDCFCVDLTPDPNEIDED